MININLVAKTTRHGAVHKRTRKFLNIKLPFLHKNQLYMNKEAQNDQKFKNIGDFKNNCWTNDMNKLRAFESPGNTNVKWSLSKDYLVLI